MGSNDGFVGPSRAEQRHIQEHSGEDRGDIRRTTYDVHIPLGCHQYPDSRMRRPVHRSSTANTGILGEFRKMSCLR